MIESGNESDTAHYILSQDAQKKKDYYRALSELEKAIADAKYVWLSGKKELKKIEELTELENESKSIFFVMSINWDEIRIQAAIAAMQGMLANAALVDDARLDYRITIEQAAVSYANTLIEELKKKG